MHIEHILCARRYISEKLIGISAMEELIFKWEAEKRQVEKLLIITQVENSSMPWSSFILPFVSQCQGLDWE